MSGKSIYWLRAKSPPIPPPPIPSPQGRPQCTVAARCLSASLASTVADDDIAIGSVADRCLLSGVIQTSHFEGVTTVLALVGPRWQYLMCRYGGYGHGRLGCQLTMPTVQFRISL